MAALTRRVVKVTVLTAGAVPLIGLAGSVSASSKDEGKGRLMRACDLPVYEVAKNKKNDEEEKVEFYDPSAYEKQISNVRKSITSFFESFTETYDSIKANFETGVDHSKATLNYVQTNPGELPRVCFISVATMGGFVLGYRGGILRKVIYAGIAAGSSAALCYPKYTVDMTSDFVEEATKLWKDNIGWPLEDTPTGQKESTPEKGKKSKEVKGDPGQSNAEDKDMYNEHKAVPVPGYRPRR